MKNSKKTILLTFLVLGAVSAISGQTVSDLTADWERAKAFTLEYLEAMPADKYGFKATPEVRSFAQQMLHLTDANYGFTATAAGIESPVAFGESEKTADISKPNVIKLVTAGYDFVIKGLQGLNDTQLKETVTLFDRFELTRGQAFAKLFEHQTHHRGQATIYLRLAGVTPPGEKLF